jgi:putative ABC transport system ATP-binding protein
MNNIIELRDVGKTYRAGKVDVIALRDINLAVAQGELLSIVGPSGCGKSTLLYVIGGLTRTTAGVVKVEGKEMSGLADNALSRLRGEKMGFVFQRFNLLPALTIIQNIAVAEEIRSRHLPNGAEIERILDLVGLREKKKRKPAELSMGEQQRAAIARAIIHRPAILLADEPTGNLDSGNSAKVMEIFSRMNREIGQTTLLVTHNREVAATAHRVVRMRDGKIV